MIKKILIPLTVIGAVISLSGCTKSNEPVHYKTVYEDRIVTKTEYKPIEIPLSFYSQCKKPLKVSQMLNLDQTTEDDLVEAFKTSYLKHLQCYKAIQEIQKFQDKVKTTYETQQ